MSGYINRLLNLVTPLRSVTLHLTSHPFQRGGAHHANVDDRLAAQWILDRGGGVGGGACPRPIRAAHISSSPPRKDRKVARVLGDWNPDEMLASAEIAKLASRAQDGLV